MNYSWKRNQTATYALIASAITVVCWTSTSCVQQHSEVFPTSAGHSLFFQIALWSVSLPRGELWRLRALLQMLPTFCWGAT